MLNFSLKYKDNLAPTFPDPNIPTKPILKDNLIGLEREGKNTPKSMVTPTLAPPDIFISKEFSLLFSKSKTGPNPTQTSDLTEGSIEIAHSR